MTVSTVVTVADGLSIQYMKALHAKYRNRTREVEPLFLFYTIRCIIADMDIVTFPLAKRFVIKAADLITLPYMLYVNIYIF